MQRLYELVESLGDIKSSVLLTGESGTGKGLLARAIHERSGRADKPFVTVSCSSLSEDILESELFGHVRGAFTGAVENRVGRFELADGGTVFLDEIGDVSPKMQLRLLRVIEEGMIERLGDPTPRSVDVRVIAATNRDLKARVSSGNFREDLFYRLRVIELHVPPLRQRKEDIPLLVEHFLDSLSVKLDRPRRSVSADVMKILVSYDWPGNVREFAHALEHAMVVSHSEVIEVEDLPPEMSGDTQKPDFRRPGSETEQPARKPQEFGYKGIGPDELREVLARCRGNKSAAARMLDVDRKTIYRKIRQYGLED